MSKRGYIMKVSRSELNVFLDDLVWEKWGIGHYYTVNAYVAGQVISEVLITYWWNSANFNNFVVVLGAGADADFDHSHCAYSKCALRVNYIAQFTPEHSISQLICL